MLVSHRLPYWLCAALESPQELVVVLLVGPLAQPFLPANVALEKLQSSVPVELSLLFSDRS